MNILYLAPIPYNYLKQRPQYIAEGLAKNNNVYYLNPTVSLLTMFNNKNQTIKSDIWDISNRFHVVNLNGGLSLPYRLKIYDKKYVFAVAEYCQIKRIMKQIDVIFVAYPGWADLVSHFKNVPIIYDIMDDYVSLTENVRTKKYIQKASAKLELEADIVICSSIILCNKLAEKRDKVFLVKNAMPDDYYDITNFEENIGNGNKFLYVGTIADWFDNEAVNLIAEYPNNELTLVGPISTDKIYRENVIYTGKVDKIIVKDFIRHSGVCLYPFKRNELLETINPVKIYEYLAFNKIVIAVNSVETREFAPYIYLYSNKEELHKILNCDLKRPFDTVDEYEKFICENTWTARVKQINKIMEENL